MFKTKNVIYSLFLLIAFFILPVSSFAQTLPPVDDVYSAYIRGTTNGSLTRLFTSSHYIYDVDDDFKYIRLFNDTTITEGYFTEGNAYVALYCPDAASSSYSDCYSTRQASISFIKLNDQFQYNYPLSISGGSASGLSVTDLENRTFDWFIGSFAFGFMLSIILVFVLWFTIPKHKLD